MTTTEAVRTAFEQLEPGNPDALTALEKLYHPDMRFADPLQKIEGREAFMEMNRRLLKRARKLKFHVRDAIATDKVLMLTWTLDFAPRIGPTMHFEGASRLALSEGKITDHQDFWDPLGSFVDTVPGARVVYHRLTTALA